MLGLARLLPGQFLASAEVYPPLLGLLDAVHLAYGPDLGLELGNRYLIYYIEVCLKV